VNLESGRRHTDGQRRLVPGGGAQLPQFLEAVTGHFHMDPKGGPAQHGARGDTHGCPFGVIAGQSVGDLAGALPTQPGRGDVAVGRPRCGAHLPAIGGVPITGGLQVLGDQCGVLVSQLRIAAFDRGGQPPVQLGAVGFQLRFVSDCTDQGMPECVFGARREP
jgi:hypothetical protein